MKDISKMNLFWIASVICALGGGFIYFGDGSEHPMNKTAVVCGVVLTIGGIGILRYLLFAKRSK